MADFEIKVLDEKLQKALKEASDSVDDLTIPFSLMVQSWFKSNVAIFSLKGPGKYADLSDKYKQNKKRLFGFVYPILKASGRVEKSETKPGGEAITKIINKKTLLLGSKVPYVKFLQFGTKHKKTGTKRMPARPPVLVGAEQTAPAPLNTRRDLWIKMLEDYVRDRLKKAVG